MYNIRTCTCTCVYCVSIVYAIIVFKRASFEDSSSRGKSADRRHDAGLQRRTSLPSPMVDVGDFSLWSILRKNIGESSDHVHVHVHVHVHGTCMHHVYYYMYLCVQAHVNVRCALCYYSISVHSTHKGMLS